MLQDAQKEEMFEAWLESILESPDHDPEDAELIVYNLRQARELWLFETINYTLGVESEYMQYVLILPADCGLVIDTEDDPAELIQWCADVGVRVVPHLYPVPWARA